jgi:hypothetical protein
MSEQVLKFPQWQKPLQELLVHLQETDIASRIAAVENTIRSRLRIMTPADREERQALEDALSTLTVVTANLESPSLTNPPFDETRSEY